MFLQHDVTKPLKWFAPLDFVWHLASPASPIDYAKLPLETLRVGSEGTRNALETARECGASFLLASTSEVYGSAEVHPQPETYWGAVNPIGPRSVYDEAKRYAEALTMAYNRVHGMDTHIVRLFNVYGTRMRDDDGRAIPTFIRQARAGEPLTVFGDGTQTRSFCWVEDTVDGIVKLMHHDYAEPVNIGNDEEVSIGTVALAIAKLHGRKSKLVCQGLPVNDPPQRRPDLTLSRAMLGWQPTTSLMEGLTRLCAHEY